MRDKLLFLTCHLSLVTALTANCQLPTALWQLAKRERRNSMIFISLSCGLAFALELIKEGFTKVGGAE
jgi:hypothetical protein